MKARQALRAVATAAFMPFELSAAALGSFPPKVIAESPVLSYEDEFESLGLGVSHEAMSTLARTRYALGEGATLDALSLLGSEYRS